VRDIVANAFDGTKWYEDRKHEMIYINDLLYRVPAEIIVQSEQPTGSLSDKDAAELAKSGVATQLVPYTDVIVQGGTTTICTLAFANTPVQKAQLAINTYDDSLWCIPKLYCIKTDYTSREHDIY